MVTKWLGCVWTKNTEAKEEKIDGSSSNSLEKKDQNRSNGSTSSEKYGKSTHLQKDRKKPEPRPKKLQPLPKMPAQHHKPKRSSDRGPKHGEMEAWNISKKRDDIYVQLRMNKIRNYIYISHLYIYITIDTCYIHVAFRKLSLWLYFVAAHVTGFTRMSAVKHRKTSWVSVGDGWFHLWQKLVRWSNVTMLFVGDIGL